MSATAAQRRYWAQLAALGCLVCGLPAQIAHCHGGSITERTHEPKAKGKKLQRMDWLVLALCQFHHHVLDHGVAKFELAYGTQAAMIDYLCKCFEMDLWGLARSTKQTLLATN